MTKKKLIITLCAFVLVVAIGVVGVLASTMKTVTLSSQVSFTAVDVVGTTTLTVENNNIAVQLDGTSTTKTFSYSHNGSVSNFTIPAQGFAEQNRATIEYKFVFENSGDKAQKISVTPTLTQGVNVVTTITNVNIATPTFTYGTDGTGSNYSAGSTELANGQKAIYTYTLTLVDATVTVPQTTVSFAISINPTI